MAETSWPAAATSRVVSDTQYEVLGRVWSPFGLCQTLADTAVVYADSSGRQVKVHANKQAVIDGHGWQSDTADQIKSISANASGSTRYDLIVLRLDRATWGVTAEIVQGIAGSGLPALTQDAGASGKFEIALASVAVAPSATTINAGDVTNLAPYVTATGLAFPTAAARDVNLLSPPQGLTAYVADTGNVDVYDGANWAPVAPRRMGSAVWTSQAVVISPEIIVAASAVTFTAVAGRRYKVTVSTMYSSTGVGDNVRTRLRYAAGASLTTSGTNAREVVVSAPAANAVIPLTYVHELTGVPAGQTTIGLGIERYPGGTGTVALGNAVGSANSLLIEDIGT